ncbi:Retrovirus-related Pol polyprotein from transposon RE1 [Vitis vinifera]|uniref:Retrovirus-related Pol polyprotein from transposon RE1 n=1 Tax=Vitis vinifera TaxID=29760 RepID=A0A438EN46_VITVI|nr:Retrovirus-related Pol polyprotein from transposon RE1 [Vitis vinifera]
MPPSNLDPTLEPAPTSTILRLSTCLSRPPDWYGFFSPVSLVATLSTIFIPSCYKQAMKHECWQNAMQTELQALEENHTWDIVPCPPIVKAIGSKWVFSVKLRSNGSLDRYKARLMDMKNAFLHGDLQEEIYMKLPSGMTKSSPHDVCKLKRSLYGLKQAPRAWKDEGDLLDDPTLYQRLVGSLIYLTTTRPDISYVVHQVSQFMTSPRHLHLAVVRCIIRYLRGSPTRGLFFPTGSSLQLVAYSDADWGGCTDTRRSTAGWCMFLGDDLISWRCKKQDCVSKSSTEAEYRAMSTACFEIIWLHGLLEDLGFPHTTSTPLHADNISAIQIATNLVFHERTKHIEVDCHSIRDTLKSRVISLPHI